MATFGPTGNSMHEAHRRWLPEAAPRQGSHQHLEQPGVHPENPGQSPHPLPNATAKPRSDSSGIIRNSSSHIQPTRATRTSTSSTASATATMPTGGPCPKSPGSDSNLPSSRFRWRTDLPASPGMYRRSYAGSLKFQGTCLHYRMNRDKYANRSYAERGITNE